MVKTSGDGRIVNDIEMCIEVNGKIKRNADYSEADFAIRTGTYGEYKYTPLGLTTTDSGSHLCADRKTLDEYYCPILRVPAAVSHLIVLFLLCARFVVLLLVV